MMRLGLLEDVLPSDIKPDEMTIVSKCPVCPLAKGHRLPFPSTRPRAATFLENVHVDLSGIVRTTAMNNEEYYIMFTDDYSSYRVTYGIPDKTSQTVYECFVKYIAFAERQTGRRLKMFSLDGGGEFINHLLTPHLEELGIITRVTAPHTAEQNGVSERANRTINTKARCMMIQSGAPIRYWYHAVRYAVMLQNRTITTVLNLKESPYGLWHGRKASLSNFHPFGCMVYRHIRKALRNGKFDTVTSVGVLIGKSEENRNFEVLDMETNKVHISHDVTFQPMVFPLRGERAGPLEWDFFDEDGLPSEEQVPDSPLQDEVLRESPIDDDEDVIECIPRRSPELIPESTDNSESQEKRDEEIAEDESQPVEAEDPPPRRSARERRPVDRYSPSDNVVDNSSNYLHECREAMKPRAEPKSYKMAMKSVDAKEWKAECDKEMRSIKDMGVWDIVPRPTKSPVVGGRWHFKLKLNPDGSINKHKARYVAKGYTQTEGVDYNDTYAPTGRLASFRILVAVAAAKGWNIE